MSSAWGEDIGPEAISGTKKHPNTKVFTKAWFFRWPKLGFCQDFHGLGWFCSLKRSWSLVPAEPLQDLSWTSLPLGLKLKDSQIMQFSQRIPMFFFRIIVVL